MKIRFLFPVTMLGAFLAATVPSFAQASPDGKVVKTQTPPPLVSRDLLFQWWNGTSSTDNWFGLGNTLSNNGLTISGAARQEFFGQVAGGYPNNNQSKGNWINEEKLKALFDFGQIFKNDALDGLTFLSYWRYRNLGNNPAYAAGTVGNSSMFNPTDVSSGFGMRMMSQQLQYTTRNNAFTINAGWENPYDQFLQQPLSKIFDNNVINSAKGIGGTLGGGIYVPGANGITSQKFTSAGVGWSSSYSAWGGTLKVKPTSDTYVMSGLYMAIAGTGGISASEYGPTDVYPYTQTPASMLGEFKATGLVFQEVGANGQPLYDTKGQPVLKTQGFVPGYSQNHGFNTAGAPPFNPNTTAIALGSTNNYGNGGVWSQNGLYNMNEIGWMPKFGQDKLEGKYAIGSYIWGQQNTSFVPVATTAYSPKVPISTAMNQVQWGMYLQADQRLYAVKEQVESPSLDDKNPVTLTSKVTDKGLYMFNEFTFSTPQNCQMPFYFQTGLAYKGLIPHRDKDTLALAFGAGFYSSYYNEYINDQNTALKNAVSGVESKPNGPIGKGVAVNQAGAGYTFYGAYVPTFSSTEVLELTYNIQINKWLSFKPDAQVIFNPAGNGTVNNDYILGARLSADF